MPDFFMWRSCDISGTGAREALARNADIFARADALLNQPSGLPPDTKSPPGSALPTIQVSGASWCSIRNTGRGTLPPGTYAYQLVPVDTCTGRTGAPIPLPSLTVGALGEEATLCLTLSETPDDCVATFIQRDGVMVGQASQVSRQVVNGYPVVTQPQTTGTFQNGTGQGFDILAGADLQAGDSILYQGKATNVASVTGAAVVIQPAITFEPAPTPTGFFDIGQRTGVYLPMPPPDSALPSLPFGIPILPTSLTSLNTPVVPGLFCVPQAGDVINWGSKTGLVYGTNISVFRPFTINAGIIPFGLLPPPLPAGIFQLVYRPVSPLGINQGAGLYSLGTTTGFTVAVSGGMPLDPTVAAGQMVAFGNEIQKIASVSPAGLVTLDQSLSGAPAAAGVYFIIPQGLSSLFQPPTIAPTGSYQRLSRLTQTTVVSGLVQVSETGADQTRTGVVPASATQARQALDQVLTQNARPSGLSGLLAAVRGPSATQAAKTFNDTYGKFTHVGGKLRAVNALARLGTGDPVDLTYPRYLVGLLCGSVSFAHAVALEAANQGVAVFRYKSVVTRTPAADCPPGQPDLVGTTLSCVGLASTTNKLGSDEQARVFFRPDARFVHIHSTLMGLGLTEDEATAAANLEVTGRILSSQELAEADLTGMISIGGLQGIGDVLADPRFTALDLNDPTDGQVASAAAARGSQGIGTRDTGGQPVADFGLLGLNLLANVAVNLCDLDAALASVPEPQRTQVAAALAFMDDGIKKAIRFGTTVEQTINEPQTKAIIDTIAGLTIAVATDPTLSCLVGQGGQNPFGADLRTIDSFLLSGLPQVTQRFSLLQLSLKAVDTLLCAGVGMAQSLLPTAQGNDLKRLIGCLPPLELVAPTLAFSAGGLDLQIALQCSNDNLLRLQRMVEVALSEVNEVIAFFNQLKNQNFVTHALQARNDACSSDVSVVQVTAGASGALGVGL